EIFTADGWMKTGDLAAWDGGGRLLFRGRLKEMLKSGGINIAPREIEMFLQDRPGVAEAYVVGLPDPAKGEVPVAVVVAEPGASPDAETLKRACRAELAAYKTPQRIEIVERAALPVTATGKVRKHELAERLARPS
ncbi:MAG: long-chain fatty acid--CoA ligase, partial [Alphaproteobacteria bacterium]|nr:long-chain fatty acid--CoA ligase [Alphaproteobacteria bacterium]